MSNKNLITIWYVQSINNSEFGEEHPEDVEYEDAIQETYIVGGLGGYKTLCGLDGNDPYRGQFTSTKQFNKVTCSDCIAIWKKCREIPKRLIEG